MIKPALFFCAPLFVLLAPAVASAHITSHTLDVSGMEANYTSGAGSITFTDDGLSCGGAATFVVFYLADPTSGAAIGSIDGEGASNVHNGVINSKMDFAEDGSFIPVNGIPYDIDVAYFTAIPAGNYNQLPILQSDLLTTCAIEQIDTMNFDDPGLLPGTFLTVGTPTYNLSHGFPSVQIPYTDDYGDEAYYAYIFEPIDSDPIGAGANGSYEGAFTPQNSGSPWDWYEYGYATGAFTAVDYGKYTFAIVPTNSECVKNDLATLAACSPEFTTSKTIYLGPDTTPPVIATTTDISVEATSTGGAIVSYLLPSATDDVDGTDPVSCTPPSATLFSIGTTTVSCVARDAAGNTATSTFDVFMTASTTPEVPATSDAPPAVTSVPANMAGLPAQPAGNGSIGIVAQVAPVVVAPAIDTASISPPTPVIAVALVVASTAPVRAAPAPHAVAVPSIATTSPASIPLIPANIVPAPTLEAAAVNAGGFDLSRWIWLVMGAAILSTLSMWGFNLYKGMR